MCGREGIRRDHLDRKSGCDIKQLRNKWRWKSLHGVHSGLLHTDSAVHGRLPRLGNAPLGTKRRDRRTSSDDSRLSETCLTGRMRASCWYHFRKTCQHLGGKVLVRRKLTSLILSKGPIFCTFNFCLDINFSYWAPVRLLRYWHW